MGHGYYSIYSVLVVSCFLWSGASYSSSVLLSHPSIQPSSHMTIILISTIL